MRSRGDLTGDQAQSLMSFEQKVETFAEQQALAEDLRNLLSFPDMLRRTRPEKTHAIEETGSDLPQVAMKLKNDFPKKMIESCYR